MAFTNSEKQARYRERHLGVDGEKVRVGLILNATTRAKIERLARHKGSTIGKALKVYLDGELTQHQPTSAVMQ
jgi:hypothetical protein